MVFRRTSRSYKRRPRRRVSWYNRKYSTLQLAKKAWYATKYLKGLVNSEMFHKNNTFTLGAAQSQIWSMVNVAIGDDDASRTGNSILLRNLYVRGTIEINSAVTGDTRVTCMLVKDKQQIADSSPSISDIVTSATDPDTLLATGTLGRFKIMWRKTYILTPASGGRNALSLNKYWKIYDHVRYNGPLGTDTQKNGYYLVVISSENVNYPSVRFNTRTGYHDN